MAETPIAQDEADRLWAWQLATAGLVRHTVRPEKAGTVPKQTAGDVAFTAARDMINEMIVSAFPLEGERRIIVADMATRLLAKWLDQPLPSLAADD